MPPLIRIYITRSRYADTEKSLLPSPSVSVRFDPRTAAASCSPRFFLSFVFSFSVPRDNQTDREVSTWGGFTDSPKSHANARRLSKIEFPANQCNRPGVSGGKSSILHICKLRFVKRHLYLTRRDSTYILHYIGHRCRRCVQ